MGLDDALLVVYIAGAVGQGSQVMLVKVALTSFSLASIWGRPGTVPILT